MALVLSRKVVSNVRVCLFQEWPAEVSLHFCSLEACTGFLLPHLSQVQTHPGDLSHRYAT